MGLQFIEQWPHALGFEAFLLPLHPGLLRSRLRLNGLGSCTEVVADVIKIQQIATLGAKALVYLLGNPGRAIADSMHPVAFAKAGSLGTCAQLLARRVYVACQGGGVHQLFAALHMGQADLGLLPLHAFAFSLVWLAGIALHGGHHGAVHFSDEALGGRYFVGQSLGLALAALVDFVGVAQRDFADGALGDDDAVVLYHLVHDLRVG